MNFNYFNYLELTNYLQYTYKHMQYKTYSKKIYINENIKFRIN